MEIVPGVWIRHAARPLLRVKQGWWESFTTPLLKWDRHNPDGVPFKGEKGRILLSRARLPNITSNPSEWSLTNHPFLPLPTEGEEVDHSWLDGAVGGPAWLHWLEALLCQDMPKDLQQQVLTRLDEASAWIKAHPEALAPLRDCPWMKTPPPSRSLLPGPRWVDWLPRAALLAPACMPWFIEQGFPLEHKHPASANRYAPTHVLEKVLKSHQGEHPWSTGRLTSSTIGETLTCLCAHPQALALLNRDEMGYDILPFVDALAWGTDAVQALLKAGVSTGMPFGSDRRYPITPFELTALQHKPESGALMLYSESDPTHVSTHVLTARKKARHPLEWERGVLSAYDALVLHDTLKEAPPEPVPALLRRRV